MASPPLFSLTEWVAAEHPRTRLHIVTGKGGVGKTTMAGALALALAYGGQRVLLAEVEDRGGIAPIFDAAPLEYSERQLALDADGGEIVGLAVRAREALMDYLDIFYRLGRAGKALDRLGAVDFATTIAPGLRDVLLIGKVYEAVRRRDAARPSNTSFDAVVLDAPPTGRIGRFLNVNSSVAHLAKMGPVYAQAQSIDSMLHSETTLVHGVTTLEELAVQEAAEAAAELKGLGLPRGMVLVNMRRQQPISAAVADQLREGSLAPADLTPSILASGLAKVESRALALAGELIAGATAYAERLGDEAEQLARLTAALPADRPGRPQLLTVPFLPDGIDLAGLYELSDVLRGVPAEPGPRADP
jgi:hypothetical protein